MAKGKSRVLNHPLATGFSELKRRLESLPGQNARIIVINHAFSSGGRRELQYGSYPGGAMCTYHFGGSAVKFKVNCLDPTKLMADLAKIDQELRIGRKVA